MGSINNSFRFGTVDSADYNLLVAGDGTFNAPERDVDTIEIPGRNGDLLIDKGRFKNITVEYTVYCYADDLDTFRTQLRNFRNALSSQKGYQKLTDTFHPDEYRLGTFISGFEAEPVMFNTVAEVVLKFDCKPQRFLLSGDEPIVLGEWGETETYSGSIVSFDGTETTAIKSLKVNIEPNQSGSGDPSPQNIRSISGWDEVIVSKSEYTPSSTIALGKNIFNGNTPNVPAPCHIEAGQTFVASASSSCGIRWYDANMVLKDYWSSLPNDYNGRKYRVYTMNTGCEYFEFYGGANPTNLMVEIGSAPTPYVPYGSTITTNLPQTVYGGVLDVVSGKLVIDKAMVDLGSLAWGYDSGNQIFYTTSAISGIALPETADVIMDIKSDIYKASAWYPVSIHRNNYAITIYRTGAIWVNNFDYTTGASFKTAMNGHSLVYPLATPTEIQLTPTEVNTLLGANNIWSDAGTVEVEVGENPNILTNPTPFTAQPVFEVEGSGTLTVGNVSMTIANNGTTIIDSEMMEAYEEENGAIISRNDMVSGEFPTLKEGNNNIGTVGLTSVKVKPRWWEV